MQSDLIRSKLVPVVRGGGGVGEGGRELGVELPDDMQLICWKACSVLMDKERKARLRDWRSVIFCIAKILSLCLQQP